MASKNKDLIQCEDCGRWLPIAVFLKHWHDVEEPAIEWQESA